MESKHYKIYIKIIAVLLILPLSLPFAGCIDGELDVSRLMEKPLDYSIPIVKNVEERFWGTQPDINSDFTEYYVDIRPTFGESLRISQVEILPQLIMEAYNDPDNIVEYDFKQSFGNRITVFDDTNQEALEIQLASDGTIYARLNKNSPVFRFPEYVYYVIEGALWKIGDSETDITDTCNSLIDPLQNWSPSMGPEMVELRIEHDIKTMLYLMYGYSDAVFVNYKIYSNLDLDRQYKLYMLLSYEGYDYIDVYNDAGEFVKTTFWPRYGEVIPVQMVYSWVEGNLWSLTEMKFADYANTSYNNFKEADVRSILPFLDTQEALVDLDDTSIFEDELERQAMEYLSDIGKGYVQVVDRK